MPYVDLDDNLVMYYQDESHVNPWDPEPETVLMIHGMAESSQAWFAWVPHLSRNYRVLRVDNRGLGKSTIPPAGYPWSLENYARDIRNFLDVMGITSAHIVGAKLGGAIALTLAATYPSRVSSVTVVAPLIHAGRSGNIPAAGYPSPREWAEATMPGRLGKEASDAQQRWWVDKLFCVTDPRLLAEAHRAVDGYDIVPLLPDVLAPTLVMVSTGSSLHAVADMTEWVKTIPRSELMVLDNDAYHLAAVRPDSCAEETLKFLRRASPRGEGSG